MKIELKRRIILVVLVFFSVWPLAHYGVVHKYDLYPWKWFGWAMYTVPVRRLVATATSLPDGRQLKPGNPPSEQDKQLIEAYNKFSSYYMQLGELVEASEFARALFKAFPDVNELAIKVQDVRLDRETAMIILEEIEEPQYTYTRSELMD